MSKKKPSYVELERRVRELEKSEADRKRTEDDLSESEERFRQLAEASFEGIGIHEGGVLLEANNQYFEMFGYEKEELLGKQVIPLTVAPESEDYIKSQLASASLKPYEAIGMRKDGTKFPTEIQVRNLKYRGRNVRVAAIKDITERKLAQEALRESEEKFRNAFDNAPLGFAITTATGKIIALNQTLLSLYRMDFSEISKMSAYKFYVNPEDRDRLISIVKKEGGIRNFETQQIRQDGSTFWISMNMNKFQLAGENVLVTTFQDITERKRTEGELQKSALIIDSTSDGVINTDTEGMITFWNRGAEKIFGYRQEEVLGKSISIIYKKEDLPALESMIADLMQGVDIPGIEVTGIDKNRNDVHVLLSLTTLKDSQGNITELVGITKDITERKRAEETLRESEARLNEAQRIAQIGNWEWKPETGELYWSEEIYRSYGLDQNEVTATLEHALLPIDPDDRPLVEKAFETAVSEGSTYDIVYRITLASGEERYIRSVAQTDKDASGKVTRIYGTAQNITELKEAEEKHSALIANISDVIAIIDSNGIIKYKSPNITKHFGWLPEDLIGREAWVTVDPEDRERIQQGFYELFQNENRSVTVEYNYIRKDGTTVPIELNAVNLVNNPLINGILCNYRNISERRQAEKQLVHAKEEVQQIFDLTLNLICVSEPKKSRFKRLNLAWTALFGYSLEELYAEPFLTFVHPEDKTKTFDQVVKQIAGKPIISFENRFCCKDGTYKWLEWNATPENEQGLVYAVARDVTERKLLEEERAKAAKLESIGVLAGGIAHDFNNILTSILGNISLASMVIDQDRDKTRELLEESEKACLRARDLTQQLLTFSKGGQPIKKTISLAKLIRDAAGFSLRGSNVSCEYDIPAELWSADVDEGQISQVINNLVINADQAMPGGGTITIKTENLIVESSDTFPLVEGKYVKISIKDQGIGIQEDHLSKIFDPYFTTKQKGNGLGLSTTYSIINKHGGYIEVESGLMVGTTFQIYLPASSRQVGKKEGKKKQIAAISGRVLVMDDEQALLNVLSKMLVQLGHEVECAEDGSQAIRMYKKAHDSGQRFDVVILDLTIPGGMGGQETIKRLVKIDPEVKAIVSSGYSNDPVLANYRDHGFSSVVSKPYRFEELREVLQGVLKK